MDVFKSNIRETVEGVKQYIIPLFQREYVWEKKNWETLFENIMDLYESETPTNHFMGAIVTMPTQSRPHGISKFTLIDGQQRLTTLFIFLIALKNKAKEENEIELVEKINNTLIVNPYEKGAEYYKILPTDKEHDKICFQYLVNLGNKNKQNISPEQDDDKLSSILATHKIKEAYDFFFKQISIKLTKGQISIEKLLYVVTMRLDIVSIVLSENENAYFVFESLNATGVKLQPSDLIRNYFMMRVDINEQKNIYEEYWKPIEKLLIETKENEKVDRLPDFIRYYLASKINNFVNDRDIYNTLKTQEKELNNTKEYLEELLRFAKYYHIFFNPQKEIDKIIRKYLENILALDNSTCYIFLLPCYNDYKKNNISKNEFIEILRIIENYLLRRYILGIESRDLNRFFPTLYHSVNNYAEHQAEQAGLFEQLVFTDLSNNTFVDNLRKILNEKNRKYPKDAEFLQALKTFELYGTGMRTKKCKMILSEIEMYLCQKNKEKVMLDNLTIEHIMPQDINTTHWKKSLGHSEQSKDKHEALLHTLGNLTLTGYNSELSNKPFLEKKETYSWSKLEMNKYFDNLEKWDFLDIEQRTHVLSKICLEIWRHI